MRAKAYLAAAESLMAMDVTACKKSEIHKKGREVVIDIFNSDDDEDPRYY
jgi:hypothetical protein